MSSQHVHIDHDNCFEIIIVKGKTLLIEEMVKKLKAIKGVKYSTLTIASTGKDIN